MFSLINQIFLKSSIFQFFDSVFDSRRTLSFRFNNLEDTLTESGGHPDGIGNDEKRQQRAPPRDRNGGASYQVHVHF